MSAQRLPAGGDIDRRQPLSFTFEGRRYSGYEGDTLASALLASSVRHVGRSFKYHRLRGIWGAWVEEPNALVDIRIGGRHVPNARATTELLVEGMAAIPVNASPSISGDRAAFLDSMARFITAGFYYKTFMRPSWHFFEPRIRQMAGLGRVDPAHSPQTHADQVNVACDVLIVGAGPAGLAAALETTAHGYRTVLVDEQFRPGGSLLHRDSEINGRPGHEWVHASLLTLKAAGCTVLSDTTAYGIYDHNLICLNQRHRDHRPDRLWRVRAKRIILATGAIERPLAFHNNDRPGIMSADAALRYLRRYAVLVGQNIVVCTNNDTAYPVAHAMASAGASVTLVDARPTPKMQSTEAVDLNMRPGRRVTGVAGANEVEAIVLDDGSELPADTLLVSGGWTPTVHLFCQAKGKLRWEEDIAAFVPGEGLPQIAVVGAARGSTSLSDVLAESHAAASRITGRSVPPPRSTGTDEALNIVPLWPEPGMKGRVWIDLQNDVTAKDVEIAARENFRSVEHLKRYTTLGMATDQGKTSNLNGLALMAHLSGRPIPAVGTTAYRPPYTPVPFASLAGARRGELMSPVRRLPLEPMHRGNKAVFGEYGGWLRPAYFGGGNADEEIRREATIARDTVAIFDGSPLGAIEVMGPDAAAFLDFIYCITISTLAPGRIRYGLMLTEGGIVYDDGVVLRLSETHFVVSCSSSHATGVHERLQEWRQDSFHHAEIAIHNATAHWATLTVTGPLSRKLVERLGLGIDPDDAALPHMALGHGSFGGTSVRVARVSFTGDRSYELSIRADQAAGLWARMRTAADELSGCEIGVETIALLRAEKGYIVIGKDTDGTTMPHDIGFTAPRDKRKTEFVGRRSLFTADARRQDRRQLVGLAVTPQQSALSVGAHAIEETEGRSHSIGYVTSSYWSPSLQRPIALGLIERGPIRLGDTITIQHFGQRRNATIVAPCALDPEGARLHA